MTPDALIRIRLYSIHCSYQDRFHISNKVLADEVEQCILKVNPEIQEVSVYGKPGARLSGEELISRTREAIAHCKAPKYDLFVEDFPRTGAGKVVKYKLRDLEGAASRGDSHEQE